MRIFRCSLSVSVLIFLHLCSNFLFNLLAFSLLYIPFLLFIILETCLYTYPSSAEVKSKNLCMLFFLRRP